MMFRRDVYLINVLLVHMLTLIAGLVDACVDCIGLMKVDAFGRDNKQFCLIIDGHRKNFSVHICRFNFIDHVLWYESL